MTLVPASSVMLEVERREARAATVLATTVQPGLAVAIGCGRLSVDARDERPDPDAIGRVVMLASAGSIAGCALLAGVVTLRGARYPDTEHPKAEEILRSIKGKPVDRACLWVFESGLLFERPIELDTDARGLWPVPAELHPQLRAAYRAARLRRTA